MSAVPPDSLPSVDPARSGPDLRSPAPAARGSSGAVLRWVIGTVVVLIACASALLAWRTQERARDLEQELVRRQQDLQATATEARALAQQAQESARDAAAKSALLEMRLAEVALQRGQLEDLMQSLTRSRDENVLVDIEAALRVAVQQSAITGSAEPLVATLKQADERLARYAQPRLEGVRRAIARDLDRVQAVGVVDLSTLNIRLDEAVRLVDDLPLVSTAARRPGDAPVAARPAPAASVAAVTPAAGASAGLRAAGAASAAVSELPASAPGPAVAPATLPADAAWWERAVAQASGFGDRVWTELKSLVRVSRIDHPEAMLIAPDQAYFLRENLKLRLLSARLALLSRQFDMAQADLLVARSALDRYFDPQARKVQLASDLLRQVAGQARQVALPRPDDTLAALAAASAGQ